MSSYEPGLSETSKEFPRYHEALHAVIDHVASESGRRQVTDEKDTLIRILGLVNGGKTPYDGQYVVEYDANRPGREQGTGRPMLCYPYTFGGVTLIVQKGSNRYSRWYVLAEDGKYLSRGYDSQQAATAASSGIARKIRAKRAEATS
jgi:hypothetical protein